MKKNAKMAAADDTRFRIDFDANSGYDEYDEAEVAPGCPAPGASTIINKQQPGECCSESIGEIEVFKGRIDLLSGRQAFRAAVRKIENVLDYKKNTGGASSSSSSSANRSGSDVFDTDEEESASSGDFYANQPGMRLWQSIAESQGGMIILPQMVYIINHGIPPPRVMLRHDSLRPGLYSGFALMEWDNPRWKMVPDFRVLMREVSLDCRRSALPESAQKQRSPCTVRLTLIRLRWMADLPEGMDPGKNGNIDNNKSVFAIERDGLMLDLGILKRKMRSVYAQMKHMFENI
jgi:hypothetical protein